MTETFAGGSPEMIACAGEIIAAYVAYNSVPVGELPTLIASVHAALTGLTRGETVTPAETESETPPAPSAAQIRKSIQDDGLISFIVKGGPISGRRGGVKPGHGLRTA